MMNQLPKNTQSKISYNWLYLIPAIILAVFAITVFPIWSYVSLFGKFEGVIASAIAFLPVLGIIIGTTVAYGLDLKRLLFHVASILGGLTATFIACLIIGKPPGVPDYEVVVAMPVMFFMLSIPAWAMWGAVAFFRAFRGDK